jgi:hypothetical protein
MRRTALTLFGLALLVGACQSDNGGQTGDFSGQDGEGGPTTGNGCKDTETPIDAADESQLGFSADDVLAFVTQGFEAPLAWKPIDAISYGPESGSGTLTLNATGSGEVWYVTSAPEEDGEEGGPAIGVLCPPPRLRIGVNVELGSEGGALDESFATKVDASSPRFASLSHSFDFEALSGSLAIESVTPPEGKLGKLALSATLSPAGMTGSLGTTLEVTYGDPDDPNGAVSQSAGLIFAAWPESAACPADQQGIAGIPVTLEAEALGLSGADALESYNGSTPVTLSWNGGGESELTLSATSAGDGCVRPNPYAFSGEAEATVSYPITLQAATADGKLEGTYEATMTTSPELEGDAQRVVIEVNLPLELDELAESGLQGITLPDGLHRLFFTLSSEVEDGAAHGLLRLNGLTDPPCVTDPPEPDPGGMSAPGCEGTHVDELASATWGRGTVD